VDQLIQIVGALLILAGFAAAQFGRLSVESTPYLLLNLIGSAILAWLALDQRQWGFVLLETVWAAVSLWSLIRTRPRRAVAGDSRGRQL
jgi:hypothetical protein